MKTLVLLMVLAANPAQIYHDLKTYEPQKSRQDVWMQLKTGWVEVPIINGYMPDIQETVYSDGTIYRIFDYKDKKPYHNQKYSVKQTYPSTTPSVATTPKTIENQKLQATAKEEPKPISTPLLSDDNLMDTTDFQPRASSKDKIESPEVGARKHPPPTKTQLPMPVRAIHNPYKPRFSVEYK